MKSTSIRTLALVVIVAGLLAACTTNEGALGDPVARDEAPEWLFAMQAEGDSSFDAATGRLSMPVTAVQGFTDRPYRDTRSVTPQAFVNLFHTGGKNSFTADPPNAVLTYWDDSSGTPVPRTVVCEVSGGAGVTNGRLWVGIEILEPAGTALPTRLDRASLFVDDVALGGCPPSPTDEMIVEYYNEMVFNDAFSITVEDTGAELQLSFGCPAPVSSTIPPPVMEIQFSTPDDAMTVTCNTGAITLPRATLTQQTFCDDNNVCAFDVTALDTSDGDVFSTSQLHLTLTGGNATIVPDLEPATLPLCPQDPNPCLLSGDCTESTQKDGTLELCNDAETCNSAS